MATYDITKIALPSGDIVNLKDANATKTEASTTNGNIKIDGTETQVYDGSGKADKVTSAVNGNLAGLNGSGNPTDSGISGDMTTQSASGNPISIADLKSAQIALNPVITFEPIQAGSGTPSPSNIRAISGYDKIEVSSCGKNLFNLDDILVGTYFDGKWSWGGSTSKLFDLKFKENTQYTFSGYETQSGDNKNVRPRIVYTDGTVENIFLITNTTRTAFSKTSAENKTIDYIQAYWGSDSNAYVTIENFQIEIGTSATTYEPYHKTTDLSESLGQTVYWGRLLPRTGEFEVLGGSVDLGTLTWQNDTTTRPADGSTIHAHFASFTDCKVIASSAIANMYCSIYSPSTVNKVDYGGGNEVMDAIMGGADNNRRIWIYDSRYNNTSAADFKTAMSGIMLVYELATPFTIQLTPHEIALSQDYAYISTNGTLIALDYHNGEMASLADVSQLGETVNNLNDNVTNGELTDLVKQGNYGIFYYELKKSGRLVELYLELYNVRYTTLTRIANLPTGFIPAHRKTANIIATDSGTGLIQKGFMRVEVTNTGEIQAAFMGSTSENIFADVTLMYYV